MGCNCSTGKEIEKLYAKLGEKSDDGKKKTFLFYLKDFVEKNAARLIIITVIPLLFLMVCKEYSNGNNKISLADFFGLRHDNFSNLGYV